MMGKQQQQKELFSYQIDLDRRVRADNPLRQVAGAIDFSFARAEVEPTYGHNGNVSVDPAVILKMMFLLFFDNVRSERQLMEICRSGWIISGFWATGLTTRCLTTVFCPKHGLDGEAPSSRSSLSARSRPA